MAIALLDTNVLVYIVDPEAPKKQSRAEEVMNALRANQNGRLSVQNLAEFFYTATRKLKPPLSPTQAMEQIDRFQTLWPVFLLTPLIVTEAARAVRDYQLTYYDAQIWATARDVYKRQALEPLIQPEVISERVDEPDAFQRSPGLEVLTEDDRNPIEAGRGPDLSIVVGQLVVANGAGGFGHNQWC